MVHARGVVQNALPYATSGVTRPPYVKSGATCLGDGEGVLPDWTDFSKHECWCICTAQRVATHFERLIPRIIYMLWYLYVYQQEGVPPLPWRGCPPFHREGIPDFQEVHGGGVPPSIARAYPIFKWRGRIFVQPKGQRPLWSLMWVRMRGTRAQAYKYVYIMENAL